jgi:glucose dehydrogenase
MAASAPMTTYVPKGNKKPSIKKAFKKKNTKRYTSSLVGENLSQSGPI